VILSRPVSLWNAFIVALAAAVVAGAKAAGVAVDAEFVASVVAVAFVVIGLVSNTAVTGSPLGAKR
jgi:hypothetical protein